MTVTSYEFLNAQARDLEQIIAGNAAELLA
jgi:hypothetical protein